MRKVSLPEWARVIAPGKIEVDAAEFYPAYMIELGVKEIDQFWLEVAFQCMKMDVQRFVAGTDAAPEPGGALVISVKDTTKLEHGVSSWAQKNRPPGRGVEAATKGREARQHYQRIRGFL